MADSARIKSFGEFYWYYLSEHRHPVSRTLHFIGTFGVIALVVAIPFWVNGGCTRLFRLWAMGLPGLVIFSLKKINRPRFNTLFGH
jgi:hypothetical protein